MKHFLKNNKGVAAIEFAILLPFLLLILYGTYTVATNIMISRKVDNATNDLSFLFSREGRIATNNVIPATGTCPSTGCTGGAATLDNIINNVTPLLLYPYAEPQKFSVVVSFVGMPYITDPTLAPNVARMMWSHGRVAQGGIGTVEEQVGLRKRCPPEAGTTTINGVNYTTSKYSELFDSPVPIERASLVFPGQSFLLTSVRYKETGFGAPPTAPGSSFLPDDGSSPVAFFGTPNFVRHGTYAVRSSWNDTNNNGAVDSNEFFNDMHYCTDCNILNSTNLASNAPAPSTNCVGPETALRAKCVVTPPTPFQAGYTSSGCRFN